MTDTAHREHNRALAWGLDLDNPDFTTQEELDEFRRIMSAQFAQSQDGLDFLLDEAPDVLKRYRSWADSLRIREGDESPNKWNASMIAIMFVNAITGFEDGVAYQLHNMNRNLTKAQILEQIALVFRHTSPRGMAALAKAARKHEFHEPADPVKWPTGWAPDPEAFKSGADFTTREVRDGDMQKIAGWYERTIGEVPRHVRFMARHNPKALKAYRSRYENTLRVLPKQAEPWSLLQISIIRGFGAGIREAMLLGRSWGISRTQVTEALSWGTFYGGQESLSLVDEVAGDIMDCWPS
jgi:hypothetical protein